ncbi:hypothetical protein COO60DRAFT_1046992 [Scenedesmus sp. NREL 46B-D3]|nr:hypothetical protein COO60DRAFT_1046992 [Scenedesmus sp. NREL 46B-D3]
MGNMMLLMMMVVMLFQSHLVRGSLQSGAECNSGGKQLCIKETTLRWLELRLECRQSRLSILPNLVNMGLWPQIPAPMTQWRDVKQAELQLGVLSLHQGPSCKTVHASKLTPSMSVLSGCLCCRLPCNAAFASHFCTS